MINTIQDYCILWLTSVSLIRHGMVWWNLTRKGFHCENGLWRKESKEPKWKVLIAYAQDANRELSLAIIISHYYSVFSFCMAWAYRYFKARCWLTGLTTCLFVCMYVKIYISRIGGDYRKNISFPGRLWSSWSVSLPVWMTFYLFEDRFLWVISSKPKNFSSGRIMQ